MAISLPINQLDPCAGKVVFTHVCPLRWRKESFFYQTSGGGGGGRRQEKQEDSRGAELARSLAETEITTGPGKGERGKGGEEDGQQRETKRKDSGKKG
ncbi:hypothetical protein H105_02323 [Trichophyton soudanense CBS 452.61]|uniref:Uncharacterized protein n=1 Tax=Trichophyton soudanense CBS 452.61 TaxID=1215331 RepID=A0A022Y135_TRISD|nr:hypothetical protein H104_02288 [Trichophyton rubrum CBS 289.86]EZF76298.1 hypothetical protein H105_02323 [Trichophyton soudanense CBS 452.61]KMQ43009.1 hypothetical protein HL42_6336 [Trichophyton rubrum]